MFKKDTDTDEELRKLDPKAIAELCHIQEELEREMQISQRVKASMMEAINLGSEAEPQPVQIDNEIVPVEKSTMTELLREYKDVFTWFYEDMKGLDPKFYQHWIHLSKEAKLIQQRCYWKRSKGKRRDRQIIKS